ncbi:MAG: hypothetical protein FJ004_02005 [Chloroflexi bacterium]|nr:hypothetical protein [Chloroflexota bacterium]
MRTELSKVLNECLLRLRRGEDSSACLHDYPELSPELEELLRTASFVSCAPKVSPSDDFRAESKARIIAGLRERQVRERVAKLEHRSAAARFMERAGEAVLRVFSGRNMILIPVTLLVLLALGGSLLIAAVLTSPSPQSAQSSRCTLSILSGDVEIQRADSDIWEKAGDRVVLEAGSLVRTKDESHALLTFFEGSSIKLEPDTNIEIKQVKSVEGGGSEIILKQWLGKTWSRVVKRVTPGSRYEIETPSVNALVRGTLFETVVDETAATTIKTTEGTVSVTALDEEVYVSAGQEVKVEPGTAPPQPRPITPANNELVITVIGPVVASVCDPMGSSTGYLPSGMAFNQIPGSKSTSPIGSQVITIADPLSGEYKAVLRCIDDGTSRFFLKGVSAGETVFTHTSEYEVADDSEWLIKFNVEFQDSRLNGVTVGYIEPLAGRAPEKIVIIDEKKEPQKTAATPVKSVLQPTLSTQTYTLEVTGCTSGTVTEPGVGKFSFKPGTVVSLVAKPDKGWEFDCWEGDVVDSLSPTTTITMNKDRTVTARFVKTCILAVVSGVGGLVEKPGQGVYSYRAGTVVELHAEANAGWKFDRWTGKVADPFSSTTTITINDSEVVTANFVAMP